MARQSGTMVESVSSALRAVWWLPILRGLALIVLGVLVMVEPLSTLLMLSRIAGIFLLVDGIIAALNGVLNRTQTGWKLWLVQGLVDVIFAAFILLWPGLTVLTFFYLLVVWTIAIGAVSIISSAMLAKNKDLAWPWLLAFGLLSVLFGIMMLLRAGDEVGKTIQVVGLVLGIYAFIAGAVQIVAGFSVRAVARDIDQALKGQSSVLDAINARKESVAERKAEAAAEREAEKAEREAARAAEIAERDAMDSEDAYGELEGVAEKESQSAATSPETAPYEPPQEPQLGTLPIDNELPRAIDPLADGGSEGRLP